MEWWTGECVVHQQCIRSTIDTIIHGSTTSGHHITLSLQRVGFTGEDPTNSTLAKCINLTWHRQRDYKDVLYTSSSSLYYNDKKLCDLGFYNGDFTPGQSLRLLLTCEGECHWFLDDEWRGSVHVRDFLLDQPMWGAVDVLDHVNKSELIFTLVSHPHF